MLATMLQRVYLVRCPNPDCGDTIVLPRQSILGVFEYPQCRPARLWPIDYRCTYCGRASFFPAAVIVLGSVAASGQNPHTECLYRYEFSNDRRPFGKSHSLYVKGLLPASDDELIESLLLPTGSWKKRYGKPRFAGVYPIPY